MTARAMMMVIKPNHKNVPKAAHTTPQIRSRRAAFQNQNEKSFRLIFLRGEMNQNQRTGDIDSGKGRDGFFN